jgi:hypothetical protein
VDFKRIQTRPESFLDKMFIYLNTVRKTLMWNWFYEGIKPNISEGGRFFFLTDFFYISGHSEWKIIG